MPDDTRLNDLLSQWERLQKEGHSVTPEEVCRDYPELLAELRRHVDAIQSLNPRLDLSRTDAAAATETPPPEEIRTHARYRNLRFFARGGLGEVLLAHDEDLNRDVALKLMRRPLDRDAERRARFVREAEITSRLEHPGIVPVYGVGQENDGRPCYVMRLIRGETLQKAIARFHKKSTAEERGEDSLRSSASSAVSFSSLEFRQLLTRFIGACNAVAYAHSRGVVHRDLKPANIMLGTYGEALVVDWGLAKCQGEETDSEESAPFPPSDHGSDSETRTGAVLGTPVYMSPEQAEGRGKLLGPAGDIYSLGATLYTILTGVTPFHGSGGMELLDRVRRGNFTLPRAVKPDIAPPLEAVCLKAMARQPEKRYVTAQELAADVEHWLADEPVSAFPEPWTAQAGRWSRHHRTLVRSASAAAALIVATLSVAVVMLTQANAREQEATQDAITEKRRAEKSFQQARQAVDIYFTKVSQSKLGKTPGTQELRKDLLQVAMVYYQDFLQHYGDDPTLRAEAAAAHRQVARVLRETGALEQAVVAHEAGLKLRRRLVQDKPADFIYNRDLADHLRDFGVDVRRLGRHDDGLRAVNEAITLLADLSDKAPQDDVVMEMLAKAYLNRGLLHGEMQRLDEATKSSRQGLEVLERRGQRKPDDRQIRYDTAIAYVNLANDLADQGLSTEALTLFARARDLVAEVVRRDEADKVADLQRTTEARNLLAIAEFNVGIHHFIAARYAQAAQAYEKAQAGWDRLFRANPTVADHRYLLTLATANLSYTRFKQKQFEEALQGYERARGLAQRLVEEEKESARALNQVGVTWDGAGIVYAMQGKKTEALAAFDRARSFHAQADAKAPGSPNLAYYQCQHYELLGQAYREWGELDAAIVAARKRRESAGKIALQLFQTATDFTACIPLVGAGKKELNTAERNQRQQLADEATTTLRQSIAAGFRNLDKMRSDPHLEPLRSRVDFQKLISEMKDVH